MTVIGYFIDPPKKLTSINTEHTMSKHYKSKHYKYSSYIYIHNNFEDQFSAFMSGYKSLLRMQVHVLCGSLLQKEK